MLIFLIQMLTNDVVAVALPSVAFTASGVVTFNDEVDCLIQGLELRL